MKPFALLFSLFIIVLATGCQDDDDGATPPPVSYYNAFDLNGNQGNFETNRAYLLLDDGPPFKDGYGFVFLNGDAREDNVNGFSLNTSTTNASVVWMIRSNQTLATEQQVGPTIGNFQATNDSEALYNISNWNGVYAFGTDAYGVPDDQTNPSVKIDPQTGGWANLVINSITVDYTLRTGQVDLNYTINSGSNLIEGRYQGAFDIINEF